MKGKKLVVVEGVYSMDGDVCALPEIVEVAKRHGARILIDEAHSTFLFGPNGRGVAEHFGLDKEVDFHLGTFSKSLGGQGGFVCGTRDLIDYVNAFGRSRFFSCNLAPVLAAGLLAGLRIAGAEPQLRAKLWSNVAFLRRRFAEEGIDIGKSTSQVMPVMVQQRLARSSRWRRRSRTAGLFLKPVTYPAVPKHKSRLRISVSAAHTEAGPRAGGADRSPACCARRGFVELTRYGYRDAISGFFEFPTDNARRILPRGLEPVELHHGTSIFAMTVFDFDESEVGAYGEVVDAVIVSPLVKPGGRLPKSAFYPYQVAHHHEGGARARDRALAPAPLDGRRGDGVRPRDGQLTARVRPRARPPLELTITDHSWQPRLAPLPVVHEGRLGRATWRTSSSRASRASTRRRRAGSSSTTTRSTGTSSSPRSTRRPSASCGCATGCQLFDPLVKLQRGSEARPPRPRVDEPVYVVFNPHSGKGRGAQFVAPVLAALAPAKRLEHGLTAGPGDEARLAEEAVRRGFRRIVAVGGDGTWSNVGNAILRDGRRRRSSGARPGRHRLRPRPRPWASPRATSRPAAAIVRDGRDRTIDVGRIEDKHFLNIAGFGYDVAVLEDSWNVGYLEGERLYLYCALRQLGSFRGLRGRDGGGRPRRSGSATC